MGICRLHTVHYLQKERKKESNNKPNSKIESNLFYLKFEMIYSGQLKSALQFKDHDCV